MQQLNIFIGRTYRMKPQVFADTVQADGTPHTSPDVTIVRAKFHMNRKKAWFFDANGNAYRHSDFSGPAPVIELELV